VHQCDAVNWNRDSTCS